MRMKLCDEVFYRIYLMCLFMTLNIKKKINKIQRHGAQESRICLIDFESTGHREGIGDEPIQIGIALMSNSK